MSISLALYGFFSRTQGRHFFWVLLLGCFTTALPAHAANPTPSFFQCGGALEASIWKQWNESGKEYLNNQLISKRLVAQGDTYALYDFEIKFHNLLAMAQRCQRIDRQLELAEAVKLTYVQLEQAPAKRSGKAWVCRGGAVCNAKNRLLNNEVMLNSVQFLAFATSVASGLARNKPSENSSDFADETAQIAWQHLQRWSDANARTALRKRIAASPDDVKNGSSALFFLDRDIWQISIYADLASILSSRSALENAMDLDGQPGKEARDHLGLLLKLFKSRTTMVTATGADGKPLLLADLDRGFERLYADNRYAGYSGAEKPVSCAAAPDDSKRKEKIQVRVSASSLEPVDSVGWDISHARRLVHFFDAIERNRSALQSVFGLSDKDLPSQKTMASFAHQLRLNVWNQDKDYPLFANYYSGANGWYRVAYDNGTDRCSEGYPPYGLSDSFPSGGYVTWSIWDKRIGELGQRLYALTNSDAEVDQEFIKKYYPQYSRTATIKNRLTHEMMFFPTLVTK